MRTLLTALGMVLLVVAMMIPAGTKADDSIDREAYCATCQKVYDDIMDQCPYKETDPYDPECVAVATDAKLACQLERCIYIND